MKTKRSLCLFLMFLLCSSVMFSATRTWTGGGAAGVWTDNANWGGMPFPTTGDDAVIGGGPNITFTICPATLSLNSIQITGRSVSFDGTANCALTLTGTGSFINGAGEQLQFITPSFLTVAAGATLTFLGTTNYFCNGNNTFINGTVNVNAGSTMDYIWGCITTVGATGVLNNAGTIDLDDSGSPSNIGLIINGGGTVNNTGTINVGGGAAYGTLRIVDNGNFTGNTPAYAAGSRLEYIGTTLKLAGAELPPNVNIVADVSFGNSGGVQLQNGPAITYLFAAQMTITATGRLRLGSMMTLSILGTGSYNAILGSLIRGNATSSIIQNGGGGGGCIRFEPGYEFLNQLVVDGPFPTTIFGFDGNLSVAGQVVVQNGGRLWVGSCSGTSRLTLNSPSNTLNGANSELRIYPIGTLEINGNAPINIGAGATMIYDAGSTLQYSGGGNLTAGLEFPAASPTNLIISKTVGTNVTLPGNRSLPLAPTPGVLTLTSGILHTAGFQMQVLNTANGAVVGGSANSYVSLGAGGAFQRPIQAGAGTWNFPVGDLTAYRPMALIAPSGGSTVSVQHGNAVGGTANLATILNPTQNPFWLVNPTMGFAARVQAGFPGVATTDKLGIASPTDAGAVFAGVGGAVPDVYTALTPPILTSNNSTTFSAGVNNYIRIGTAFPTQYYHNGITDAAVASSWTSMPGGLGTPAPGFNAGYTFIIQNGVTATYISNFVVPPNVTIQVDNGGTLRINGNFNLTSGGAGAAINYMGPTAVLEYFGGSGILTTNSFEFPDIMPGALTVNRAALSDLHLNAAKTIAGAATFTFGRVWNNGFSPITFNGAVSVNGANATYWSSGAGATIFNAPSTLSAGRIQLSGGLNPLRTNALLTVSGTGILELQGGVAAQIDPASTSNAGFSAGGTLQFTGGWAGTVNTQTLPATMLGNMDIQSGTVTLGAARILQGNLNIAAGQTLDVNGQNLTLAGIGTITSPNSIDATLAGSTITLQRATLDGNWFNGSSVRNFTLNVNATLTNNLTVVNNLGFTNGILTTTVGNELIAGQSCAITGVGPTRFVNGPMQTTFPVSGGPMTRALPVGKNATYLPVELRSVNTTAGMNPRVRVEAFDAAPLMGSYPFAPIGNEYWNIVAVANPGVITQCQIALGRAAMIDPAARLVSKSAPVSGIYFDGGGIATTLPPYNGLAGNVFAGFPNGFFALTGAPPATFYYQSGNADVFANWNSNIGGGGSQPPSFAAGSFYVPNGRTATFTTANASFGAGTLLQADPGGAVAIANGQTLNMNGQVRIAGGARLTLQGTGRINTSLPVQYVAPTSLLEYNAPVNRTVTAAVEFPDIFNAQLEVHSGAITLDASKHLQSTLLLNNSTINFGAANRLRLSGGTTFLGTANFGSDSTDTLIIDGSSVLAGNIGLTQLARLTMQRSGQTLTPTGTLRITQQLGLLGGNVAVRANEYIVVQNGADTAVLGGGSSSFVSGALIRRLRPNLSAMTPSIFAYPVGSGTRFLGARLENSTTGTMGADVAIEPSAMGSGGTVAPGVNGAVSTTEHWRVVPVGGEFLGGNFTLTRTAPLISPQNFVGTSMVRAGSYQTAGGSIITTPYGNGLQSASVQHGSAPFAALNSERFYAVMGVLPNAPRIFGFSPSSGGNGTMIRVTGANFTGVNAVAIGGVPVFGFTIQGDSTFIATIGNGVSGAVQVSGLAGGAASDSIFRFIPPPSLGTISPNPAGYGAPIVISGSNLTLINYISIGGVQIPVTPDIFTPSGQIQVNIPPNASNATIVITSPGGSLESTGALVLVQRPVITSVAPQIASTGEVITIFGQNFTGTRFVRFGGGTSRVITTNAGFTVNSPTRLSVVVPSQVRRTAATSANAIAASLAFTPSSKNDASAHATEEFVPITVETPGGQATSGTLQATQFFYRTTAPGAGGNTGGGGPLPQIRVDAVLDRVTTLGALVRVTGANLDILANVRLSTTLGSTTGSWFTTSSSSIQLLVPTSGLLQSTSQTVSSIATTVEFFGAYNSVIVTNAFVLVGQPRISSIQPPNAEPGETITITGTNLNLVVNATIGGQTVPYRINPDGSITLTVPMITNTTGSTVPPAGTLQLRGIGGSAVNSTTIINAEYLTGAPIIRSFSPAVGDGGTVIVVTGANLSAIQDVLVGGIPVQSFVVNSPNRVTIVLSTQASARSTATISLVTANGVIESRQNFTFTQSLEGGVNTLSQALSIPIADAQNRVQTLNNRIIGVNLSGLPLNGILAGEPRILSVQPPIFLAGQTITVLGENLNLVTTATIGGQQVPFTLTQDGRLILTAPAAASTDATLRLYGVGGFIASSQPSRMNALIAYLRTLRGLRTLNLSGTGLRGTIPTWLGEFVDLEELDISFNELEGPIASNPICLFPNLRLLNVAANRLSGQIPTCIATRERLQTLYLDRNYFTGNIPQELGTMPNLRILTLNNNTLVGSIPPSFGGISSGTGRKTTTITNDAQTLEVLDASNNQLSGTLPAALGSMTALKTLNLSNNALSGELPQEMGSIRSLEHLNLSRNRFSGSVPTTFALLTKLRSLRLNGNTFTSLPELASTRLLDTIELQSNRLQFNSLEPYMTFRSIPTIRLSYIPQDSIGQASTRQIRLSESFSMNATADGSANVYEWRKNGVVIPNATTPLLRIPAAASADAGVYVCRITNSRVPDLVLYSRAQTIVVTTSGVSLIPPELVYPIQGAENIGVQTRLVWTRLPGVDGYEVQWAEDANLRANVERRFIPQSSRDTLPTVETRISGLGRGAQIYWRVRAVVGSEASQNGSQWTNTRDFKVVPLGIDLAIGTIDAGRASIGDEASGQSVAVNVSDAPLQIESISVDAADAATFRLKTAIAAGQPFTLTPGAELPVEVSFAPRETGVRTGTLRARYRDGQGTARELTFRAIARGSGSALAVETIDFDTVRIGRGTFRTAVITNRSNETIRINDASIVNTGNAADNVFAVRDIVTPIEPIYIAAGQFQTILLSARPATSGVQRSVLRLETSDSAGKAWTERVSVDVRAFSRLPQTTDPALQLGIRATPDSVAPGGMTSVEVFIVGGNKQEVRNAAQPTFRGTLRWNRHVLSLAKTNTNGARTLSENTGTSDVQRITIPQTNWDGRSDVLFRFDAVAVAGRTDVSALSIESVLWGGGNPQIPRQPWETQVFLEEPKDSVFVAKACLAGGKRLVTSAKATTLAVVRPNPVKDAAELAFTLREDGVILLELVNVQGKVVKTLASGDYAAGDYTLQVNCSDVASGSYRIRLRTSNDGLSTSLTIVR